MFNTTMFNAKSGRTLIQTLLLSSLSLLAVNSMAADKVHNFVLLDQFGEAHQLYYYTDKSAILLVGFSPDDKIAKSWLKELDKLNAQAGDKLVIYLIDPQSQTRDTLLKLSNKWDTPYSVLMDETQINSRDMGITESGQALLVETKHWNSLYTGPVASDSKPAVDLAAQVKRVLSGDENIEAVSVASNKKSVALNIQPETDAATISYAESIAPLLQEKCVSCHQPNGIGPWAMTSYDMVRGFAPMIKEVVLTKRMPPWHADPHVNKFADDISLSIEQKQMLIAWIDGGAPRGEGGDPLSAVSDSGDNWVLGEPDLILEFPAFDIPATGSLDYQFFEVANPLPNDVWIKAVQIVPGDRKVLHHAIATFGEPEGADSKNRAAEERVSNALVQQQLMTFVPGNESYVYPDDTALLLPKGSSIFSQMHYTPTGKATTDTTKIGLYFRKDAPTYVLRHYAIVKPELNIPPMDAASQDMAYHLFDRDSVIYSLFPHAHYRGKSSEFSVIYPDGKEELLLSVPNYDFNWQRYFKLEKPLTVPAGTMLVHRTTFDNSPQNLSNPDPSVAVGFGLQSWEEMLYGGVSFRYLESDMEHTDIDKRKYNIDLLVGYLDTNLDKKVDYDELPPEMLKRLGQLLPFFDQNRNGGLEREEFAKLFEMGNQRPKNPIAEEKTAKN